VGKNVFQIAPPVHFSGIAIRIGASHVEGCSRAILLSALEESAQFLAAVHVEASHQGRITEMR
jgi:hypothetical protein